MQNCVKVLVIQEFPSRRNLGRGPTKILHTDKNFCFLADLDQTWLDCSTHEFCNLTKFGQDWPENKTILSVCKI